MSKFHASVRDLLEEVFSFLSGTLQNELLSSSTLTQKEKLIFLLTSFKKNYPELQLCFPDGSETTSQGTARAESARYSPSSPVPYVDMNGGSPYKIPFFSPTGDVDSDTYINKDRQENSENQSLVESEDYMSDEAKCIPDTPACDLYSCEKSGYLDKKRESIKGWLTPFQKRWCCVKDGILYYYEKTSDRKQRGSIVLVGYEARPLSDDSKDGKKYNHCFELVCPGKRTYQFSAASEQDLKQWIVAVEHNNKMSGVGRSSNASLTSASNAFNTDLNSADTAEDIYEIVEDVDCENQTCTSERVSYSTNEIEEYSDVESCTSSNQIFNYNEWYVGLWDCKTEDDTELSFLRGDLIHIVSKEYDSFAWWIGELQGQVGFVPKSYLMEAYEAC